MKRMHLASYDCVLCQGRLEKNGEHLFLGCRFAHQCWRVIGIDMQNQTTILDAIELVRNQPNQPFFMIVMILMCWVIWTVRNDPILKECPQLGGCQNNFHKGASNPYLKLRVRVINAVTFDLWIQNLICLSFFIFFVLCFSFSVLLIYFDAL